MSTRFVVAAVAGVVVGYFGGPQAGFSAFTAVYGVTGFLDPNAKVQGPRLDDLKLPSGAYGAPVPYVEGHPRLGGNIVWCTDKREVANEATTDGKGGPGIDTTTFTYEVDMVILIDEKAGTVPRRCFSNGKLIWTRAESADAGTLLASNETTAWREIRFYDGNVAQLPDPTYEAAVGAGNAPAYRGRSSIVIVGLNCGGSGQLPVLTWEVVTSPTMHGTAYAAGEFPLADWYPRVGPIHVDGTVVSMHIRTWVTPYTPSSVQIWRLDTAGSPPDYGLEKIGAYDTNANSLFTYIVSSDESCAFTQGVGANVYELYHDNGGNQSLTWTGTGAPRCAYFGGDLWIAANGSGIVKHYTPFAATLVLAATSSGLSISSANSITKADGYVFVTDGVHLLRLNPTTLAELESILIPTTYGSASTTALITNEAGSLFLVRGTVLYRLTGSTLSIVATELGSAACTADYSGSDPLQRFAVSGTVLYTATTPGSSGGAGTIIYKPVATIAVTDEPLDQVVTRQWVRAGLDSALLDATDLAALSVRSMVVSQITSPRQVIDTLASAFLFEAVESGNGVRMVRRGGAPVATIPFDDMGAHTGDGMEEALPRTRGNELEIPSQVTVKFSNVDDDYQDGAETSLRAATGSNIVTVVEVPIGMTPTEAKKLANISVVDALASIVRIGPVGLTRKWAALEPTDVVLLVGRSGSTFRTRLNKRTDAAGLITFEGVADDATAIDSNAVTSGGYSSSNTVRTTATTEAELLDIPILRDADDSRGIYCAAKGSSTQWRGYGLYESDDDVTYAKVAAGTMAAVIGVCSVVPGAWAGGRVIDEVDSITVDVGDGTLSGTTRDEMLADQTVNAFAIGAHGRWMLGQFRDATLQSAGVYKLTGLLLGSRGTEQYIGTQLSGDTFVLLRATGGLVRVPQDASDLGVDRHWKAVSVGKSVASSSAITLNEKEVGLKPFSPVDLRAAASDTATVISWKRRSRLATNLTGPSGILVPLGESSEAYDVEHRDASDVLVETARVSTPQWSASAASESIGLVAPAWGMTTISGEIVAVRDDQLGAYVTSKYFARYSATDGSAIGQSPALGQEVYQWANAGDQLYGVTAEFSNTVPVVCTASRVRRVDRTAIGTIAATYTAGTAGDLWGLAHDGTNVWIAERFSGNLRKLNASSLASVSSYAVNVGIAALLYLSGDLWMVSSTNEVVKWNIATTTETLRFSVISGPFDLLIQGGMVWVLGTSGMAVYNQTTGALISTFALIAPVYLAQRCMCRFSTYIAIADVSTSPYTIALFDASTGAFVRRIGTGHSYLFAVSGERASKLHAAVGDLGSSAQTRAYELVAAGLAGHSVTVYQISAAVGRGYPARINL